MERQSRDPLRELGKNDRLSRTDASERGPDDLEQVAPGIERHDHALLGSAIVSEDGASERRLRAAVSAKDWRTAATLREWRGDENELEFRLIRCPVKDAVTLLDVWSFAAMEFSDRVASRRTLTPEERASLEQDLQLEWETL